jgi:hypothetical protein
VIEGCVAFERKTKRFEITAKAGDMSGSETTLVPQYQAWKRGEKLPVGDSLTNMFTEGLLSGDAEGAADKIASSLVGQLGSAMGLSGKMDMGTPVVVGPMDGSTVTNSIGDAGKTQLNFCYQVARSTAPELSGDITVGFVVGTDGKVADYAIKTSSITDATVLGCLQETVTGFEFPPPAEPVTVEIPLVFSPG